ncbi:MAG: fimbrillin family protein [Flavobacteriales bacterium]|nr:fimbrillin family protein [Flavobacteriales bacterium]
MNIKTLSIALLATAVVACSKSAPKSNFPDDSVIRFSTEIVSTKAGMTTENISDMGIYATQRTGMNHINIKHTKIAGEWVSASQMLWKAKDDTEILAYSPYNSLWNSEIDSVFAFNSPTIQNTIDAIKSTDIVFQDKIVDPTSTDPESGLGEDGKIKLNLTHIMSKLIITITMGTSFNASIGTTSNPITEISVNDFNINGEFKLGDGEMISVTTVDFKGITPYEETSKYIAGDNDTKCAVATYECIVIPQTATPSISFIIDGKTYEYTLPEAVTLKKGTQYTLPITVGKNIVTAGAFSMTPWSDGNGANGEDIETE